LISLLLAAVGAPLSVGQVGAAEAIGIGVGGAAVGAAAGFFIVRAVSKASLSNARAEAKRIVDEAQARAQVDAERARLDGQRAILELRSRAEEEIERTRSELRESEKRLVKREDLVDAKERSLAEQSQTLTRRSDDAAKREARLAEREQAAERLIEEQKQALQAVSGMTRDQAREVLLRRVEEESRHECAKIVRKLVEEAEAEAKGKAREITLMAVQRYASEVTSEGTVKSVAIPSDEMKGRIIGREGRNIRAIEKATGVDIIVDDTPGVIVVSCFDKVRQAIAVESLEKLVADGRMHPARIEEVVEKTRNDIGERIQKIGKDAVLEVNLRGVHPKVSEAMGKLHFRTSYGQNVLRHSVEVAFLCQIIAEQLGLDGAVARRCGFLHDIGKAMDHEMEGGHPKIGMDFARQFGEREPVLNAIGGHHADIPSTSFYTPIVMAADAVSSARPGARRESLEKYVQRLNELQDIALSFRGVTEAYAIQAGREVRVMIDAAKVDDDEAYLIAHQIAKRVSDELTFPGEIRVTVLRETRAIEYAR